MKIMIDSSPIGREIYINKVIRSINSHWRYVNTRRRLCTEMQMHGVNLEICEQINLLCLYQTVSQECNLGKKMNEDHLEMAGKELVIGEEQASDLERIKNIETRQSELTIIKNDIKEALDAIQKEMEYIIHVRNVEELNPRWT